MVWIEKLPVCRYDWPGNWLAIALLSLENKLIWYTSRDPQELIDLGNDKEFTLFWGRFYIRPLKLKRLAYKLKFW
jgi:hypothetical protein